MLLFSAIDISLTVILGLLAAALHVRISRKPPWALGAVHGTLGLCGFIALLIGLQGPPRGVQMGAGPFGMVAAALLALTLATGAVPILARLRRRPMPPMVLGLHATIAIMGFVILAAYVSAPS